MPESHLIIEKLKFSPTQTLLFYLIQFELTHKFKVLSLCLMHRSYSIDVLQ